MEPAGQVVGQVDRLRLVWQGVRLGRQADGEAAFVLVNPKQGIIVLEVKGGRVAIDGGIWYSVDRNDERHGIKNPFTQVADSKYSLLRHVDISREIVRLGDSLTF